ncbi:diguanylate cyclase (GGDEF) domain protein [Campylobacter rectus RM3267]|uniref:Diguanylate cyclase/phosphodiesterase n=2 Tax=Campylobacter rectus TaxID=203 RepID=A0A6G5QPC7_CAMRE|nr:LapD/MoxY N-terminal periplasmic domain-containing protein [Campylobacter rectus]EEF15046.1 diguanylate cyclase (GGDEF) domain protein [Campylobacter rectus RM3267]QCD47444.1 diguanylate cyclase/phosphodiesterase [Campylobacter rectus]UEB48140.1 EAL domain-containing protein [Campylobacter rectus]
MTLLKQIMLAIISFMLLIFVAVGILNFSTINNYIVSQLGTNAKHTANSLGLAIASVTNPKDLSGAQTMINSVFDSGYYPMIKLTGLEGETLIESSQPLVVNSVPKWFVNNVKLEAPVAQSEIMIGWNKFGTLHVQSNTGIAYYELYNIVQNVFYVLLAMSITALLISYLGVKAIFIPLKKVQKQAEAILQNSFILQEKIPFTVDVRQIVLAMNVMITRVKDVFEQSAKTLSKYEELLYKDEQTVLFNRRYLQNNFKEYISSEEYSSGAASMITCKDLRDLKQEIGFNGQQKLIKSIASIISQNALGMLRARLNEDDFIIVSPNLTTQNAKNLTDKILLTIKEEFIKFNVDMDKHPVFAAIVPYGPKTPLKDVLTTADITLARAKEGKNFASLIYKSDKEIVLGKEQYKELIETSLKNGMFKFAGQKVESDFAELVHRELYIRLVDSEGRWQIASYFMPMVNEIKMTVEIDLYVLNKFADMLRGGMLEKMQYAINLGKDILSSAQHFNEFENALKKIKQYASAKIYIEIPNKDDIDTAVLVGFHQRLRSLGFGFGLDHFGFDAKSIERLSAVNPDYVKIPAANLIDFLGGEASEQRSWFEAMMMSRGVKIIATGVENDEQKQNLQNLQINSMQGILISEIENIG